MRAVATRSEALLWARLRTMQLGVAFQRQIGPMTREAQQARCEIGATTARLIPMRADDSIGSGPNGVS
jgi:hypothetical protein